jgi:hypothetical protein
LHSLPNYIASLNKYLITLGMNESFSMHLNNEELKFVCFSTPSVAALNYPFNTCTTGYISLSIGFGKGICYCWSVTQICDELFKRFIEHSYITRFEFVSVLLLIGKTNVLWTWNCNERGEYPVTRFTSELSYPSCISLRTL